MRGWGKTAVLAAVSMLGMSMLAWTALTMAAGVIFDVPRGRDVQSILLLLIPAFVGLFAAILAASALSHANEWSDALPVKSYLSDVAMWAGAMLGALVAAFTIDWMPVRIAAGLIATATLVILVIHLRLLRQEVADTRVERTRIARLREHGKRIRAEVTDAEFAETWVGEMLLFHVTAEYDSRSGRHRVQERILAGIDELPTAGGTVFLWVAADGSSPTDVVMELDPDSIRHPEPEQFIPRPARDDVGGT